VKEIKKEKTMRLCGLCSRELLTPFPAGMGGGGIERERQNLKQAPCLVWSLTKGSISQP